MNVLNNADGNTYVKLDFNNSMITFCADRFIDIELVTKEEQGLKVPNSAIAEKEFFLIPKDYVTKGNNNENGVLKETYTENGAVSYTHLSRTSATAACICFLPPRPGTKHPSMKAR